MKKGKTRSRWAGLVALVALLLLAGCASSTPKPGSVNHVGAEASYEVEKDLSLSVILTDTYSVDGGYSGRVQGPLITLNDEIVESRVLESVTLERGPVTKTFEQGYPYKTVLGFSSDNRPEEDGFVLKDDETGQDMTRDRNAPIDYILSQWVDSEGTFTLRYRTQLEFLERSVEGELYRVDFNLPLSSEEATPVTVKLPVPTGEKAMLDQNVRAAYWADVVDGEMVPADHGVTVDEDGTVTFDGVLEGDESGLLSVWIPLSWLEM